MENLYQSISKAINIDQDRKTYTEIFNFVRKSIIDGLKENLIFKELFADISLCGSYADNLKVTKPNEFDLVLRLKFPYHNYVSIEEDEEFKGNVFLNLSTVISLVAKQQKPNMEKFLRLVTNNDGYLLQDKFQSWFEGILTKYLLKIGFELEHHDQIICLRYIKQGPAHTIEVRSDNIFISIDFVPGFRFSKSKSISPKKHLMDDHDIWEAIPKPLNGKQKNPSFQCSYNESERRLLRGKNQFKNALRLMKKFRDTSPVMINLKSYFIKTLFLWHNQSIGQNHWNNSNFIIMDEMFQVLETALEKREILFFWDERMNMLKNRLSDNQINRMYYEVKCARKVLAISERTNLVIEDLQKIKDLFITREEQDDIPPQIELEIRQNFAEIAKNALKAVSRPAFLVGTIAFGAVAIWKLWQLSN